MAHSAREKLADFIVVLTGLLLFLFGLHEGYLNYRVETGGISTTGTITDGKPTECKSLFAKFTELGDWDFAECHFPVVKFTGPAGEPVEFQNPNLSRRGSYETGAKVSVLYRAADPKNTAVILDRFDMWFEPAAGFVFGAAAMAGGVSRLLSRSRRKSVMPHIRDARRQRRGDGPIEYRRRERDPEDEKEPNYWQLAASLFCVGIAFFCLYQAWQQGQR